MKTHHIILSKFIILLFLSTFLLNAHAMDEQKDNRHKIVIQVSTDDPRTQKIALNNAVNLQRHYGMDNIDIEVVAYGPGLGLLTAASKQGKRVSSLAMQDITFSACGNTMKKVAKKTGKEPVLLEGVEKVPAGVARILELQEQGYVYVRP